MSTGLLPNATNAPRLGEQDPDQSTTRLSSTTGGDPSLLDTRESVTDRPFADHSLSRGIINTSINSAQGRVRLHSPSNSGAIIPRAIRTGAWGVGEDGRFNVNMLPSIPEGEPEPIDTSSVPDIHSDSQENNRFHDEDNINRGGRNNESGGDNESGNPQVMWNEGEEYYEESFGHLGPMPSLTILPLPPATFPTAVTGFPVRTATRVRRQRGNISWTRAQTRFIPSDESEDDQDLTLPVSTGNPPPTPANLSFSVPPRSRSIRPVAHPRSPSPAFLNAAGGIDVNLIPHAPRTDLPPPPPLIPLPRLTKEPPATWFEGMSEDSRCPVLPDYVVDYSFPCGHALCRWCYEQICLVSDHPLCPLCRRSI